MTPDHVAAIQASFAKVMPISEQAASMFYDRLFEVAPSTKTLFKGDMREQGRKLMATLAFVVNGLGKPETVMPAAVALAQRHVSYGVKASDYRAVGEALLWTLERGLGPEWTPALAASWEGAYTALSGAMIKAAYGAGSDAESL